MNRILRRNVVILGVLIGVLIAILPYVLTAQQTTTSLRGTVTDQTGAAIPGATVELTNKSIDIEKTITSDSKGEYQFLQLVPSKYTISATSQGMGKQEKIVELLVAQPATLNFALTVSNLEVEVEVSSTALELNTTDATIGNAVNNETVQSLPMEGRNVPDLLSLQPGVLFLGHAAQTTLVADEDSRSGVVSGARSDQGNVTLDGLDNNDQVTGLAFNGVLRSTLDSVEEFRVTTTGQDAEAGRTSGAQVNVVTKSGTNAFHASAYEYNRNTALAANDWFNKHSELSEHLPNKPGQLIRNTFGVAGGGPIRKDQVFVFGSWERQPTAENQQVIDTVPTAALRSGLLQYTTNDAAGSNSGPSVGTSTYLATLTPAQFAVLDPQCSTTGTCPWGPGEDPNVLALAKEFPLPNATGTGDGYNTGEFTWSAPNPTTLNTGIVKIDYVINDKQRLFVRGNLQADRTLQPPLYPTSGPAGYFATVPEPSQDTHSDGTKGFAVGETWVISPSLVNNARFGYTRQSYSDQGPGKSSFTTPSDIGLPFASNRTQIITVPVFNAIDDISWIKGTHNFQFGVNYRNIQDEIATDAASYNAASTADEQFDGISNTGQALDPASPPGKAANYAPVATPFDSSYTSLSMGIAGVVGSESLAYNYHNNGDGTASLLPTGSLVRRHFNANELEYYFQDQWRVTSKITLTYGVRHTILQTPYEVNGQQVSPTISLHQWFNTRVSQAAKGVSDQPNFSFAPSGKANSSKPFFPMSWLNFSPRLGVAYALNSKTTIRAGAGLYFDHYGEGVVRNYVLLGSYGLGGKESMPPGYWNVSLPPRFTSIYTQPVYPTNLVPTSVLPPIASTLKYPYAPPASGQAGGWMMDDQMKTPYSYTMNLDVQRAIPGGFMLEAAYVGRIGKHLINQIDFGMPLDLVDSQSGMDYFTAADLLEKMAYSKVPTSAVTKIPYWEDLFPDAAGKGSSMASTPCSATICQAGNTATQNIYNQFAAEPLNASDDLNLMDTLCTPGCGGQLYRFYNGAFSSLYHDGTFGFSSYNAGQLILRHPMSHGIQEDFGFTWSKAIDLGSDAERTCTSCTTVGTTSDSSEDVIINSFNPKQNKGVASFDTKFIITSDMVYMLPFGKGQRFLNKAGGLSNALFDGWQINGLERWTTALPFYLQVSGGWTTAWPKQNYTIQTRPLGALKPKTTILANGSPDAFPNPTELVAGISGLPNTGASPLRYGLPGEIGSRNAFRGSGTFDIDSGLMKSWDILEKGSLKFDWEVFNTTNSVRFDDNSSNASLANSVGTGNLGVYSRTLSVPRVQQVSLRYTF